MAMMGAAGSTQPLPGSRTTSPALKPEPSSATDPRPPSPRHRTSQVDHQRPLHVLHHCAHGLTLGWDVGQLPGGPRGREAEEEGQLSDGLAGVEGGIGHVL